MTPDQDAALTIYLEEWADQLADPASELWISYTDTGPTLDLHHNDRPIIRWLLAGTGGPP